MIRLCVLLNLMMVSVSAFADWPYWRGAQFDGQGYFSGLPDQWNPKTNDKVVWRKKELGSRSTPVVLNGRIYTICRADPSTPIEGEKVICADAVSGKVLWENKFPVYLSDVPAERVGWSSVVADAESGNVFVLGVCDLFLCLDGKTGKTVWSIPLHEQYGMLSTYGGRTNLPLIFEDLVIISGVCTNWGDYARPNHRLLAFNKKSGEIVWFSGTSDLPDDTTYSGPSIAVINGQATLVLGAGDGDVWGYQPRTGRPLWHYPISPLAGVYSTPLIVGNTIYCAHAEENPSGQTMGAVAAIEISGSGAGTKHKELWRNETIMVGRCAPTFIDGRVYVIDDRCKMWIYDAKTGESIAERITMGDRKQWASMLHVDGKLYVLTENGRWAICKPTASGVDILDKGEIKGESFVGSPIVDSGRLYFPGINELYCVSNAEPGKPSGAAAKALDETPIPKNPKAAWLQVVPPEALLQPGQSQDLAVRLFNDLGQPLKDVPAKDVKFTLQGVGEIKEGKFSAPNDNLHQTAVITAEADGVKGIARIRVVPPLPWKFNFDKTKDAPAPWVGARYRHVIRPIDGDPALVKITTIPKGTRSRAWMGPSDLSNYTISSDVQGRRTDDQLPDIGLMAQGYVLDLQGNSQQLEIRSWDPVLRMARRVAFSWKEGVWYRMKFCAENLKEGDKTYAMLRGKVWPRDEKEPEKWSVEARDDFPVTQGSPGLYGSAKVAELYLDNLEITPNSP